jgi:hypothetical protein
MDYLKTVPLVLHSSLPLQESYFELINGRKTAVADHKYLKAHLALQNCAATMEGPLKNL